VSNSGSFDATVKIHREDSVWWAESDEWMGWIAAADTLEELHAHIGQAFKIFRPHMRWVSVDVNYPEEHLSIVEHMEATIAALTAERDDLEHDLVLMMSSRKVLLLGIRKVLSALGEYSDNQERGDGSYTLAHSWQDALAAAREALIAHNDIMDAALTEPEEK
jgi:predicted RNase H-like HicB family nuclease